MNHCTIAIVITLALNLCLASGLAQSAAPANELDRQLINAVSRDDLIATRKALDQGANIEALDVNEATPLMIAAENNYIALVSLLLEKGADPAIKNRQDETALTIAARGGDFEIVSVLLAVGGSPTEMKRALFEALRGGGVVILQVSDEPKKQSTDREDESPYSPWIKTVKLLLDKEVPIEARDEDRSTPLIVAAAYGETDMFKFLLSRGADIRARNVLGTALMNAACQCAQATMNGTYDIVKILLEKGADPNERGRDGMTPLMLASGMQGDPAVLTLLLNTGADPTIKNKKGKTALVIAIESYRDDKVKVLKEATPHIH